MIRTRHMKVVSWGEKKQDAPWLFSIRGRVESSYPDLLLFVPFGATVAVGCGTNVALN